MITNASCTLYHRTRGNQDTWSRVYIKECWWYEDIKGQKGTDGLKDNSTVKVRIPDISINLQKDDYLVKGNVNVSMSTIKDLSGYNYRSVKEVVYNTYGGSKHIKVVC